MVRDLKQNGQPRSRHAKTVATHHIHHQVHPTCMERVGEVSQVLLGAKMWVVFLACQH
jgi:hypothetical protein